MTTQQTVWPTFPLTLPYEVILPGPSYLASDCAGLVLPSPALPYFYKKVIEKQNQKENRKFFLDRSVFDLIEAHPYLALTDPKLLGWYLCLSPEDRKIILDEGGFRQFLQRHPALELSRHHVYVKYDIGSSSPVHPTMTSNKSKTPGAETCKFEMPHRHLELEMLHNNVRKNFTLLGCSSSRGGSQKHPDEEVCQLIHLQDSFHTAYNSPITQEPSHQKARKERSSPLSQLNEEGPSWQTASSISSTDVQDPAALASFSLDMELERCRQREKTELRRQSMTQGQSANFTYAEVSPSRSTIEYESPEYYSFDSAERNGGEDNNRSMEQVNCPLGPVEKSSTIEGCQDYMACGNESTVDNNEASLSLDNQSDNFHSIMEDDKSILVCLAGEGQKGSVSTNSEALADTREDVKSVQSHMKISSSEKYTSPMPGVPTCDIMVGTELTPCASTFTQSEDPETADKNVITEVHMADLDYLAEEFIKIRKTQEKLREQKEKMKGSGCKLVKECDCTQRAQRAELCLLALQYSMCRQHCWRLYYTSAEGGQLTATHGDINQYGPKDPPANVLSVLQKLESDCNQMRDKILEGVPLEQLKPLTVDSEKITAGTSYIPAQIIGDVVGNLPSWSCMKPQECNPAGEESGGPSDQSSSGCQDSQKQEKQVKRDTTRARRANTLVPPVRYANHEEHKLTEKQTSAACKEINTSEAWYDAEEDFESAGPAVAAETGQDPSVVTSDRTDESASDEAKSSALCVSNLPSNVTESDVMLWFEKYCPSEVRFSVPENGVRVAIVMVSGAQSAEAAVRGLNGLSVEGHTLHVEHIDGAAGGSRSQASASVSESSQDATKPQPPKPDLSSTRRKLASLPSLGSSFKHRKVVSISPTAKGTCVPQHYGTMGSFDTLMAELTQLHPDVGRQRIVDALMELRTKHQGALSGLPLRTIREMTSELLTSPPTATQL